MSQRSRRSLASLASLTFLVMACAGTPSATTTPTNPGGATPPSATGTPTGPGTTATPGGPGDTSTPGQSPTAKGGTLRIYCCATDPRSLRPQAVSGSDENSILQAIQRGLLYLDQNLGVVPELATGMPEVSADGMTYTFTLGDHNYSDGTPIVAADFVRAA